MEIKINCKMNDNSAWCKDKRIKRSLFGLGARCCLEFENKTCPYVIRYKRPKISPKGQNTKGQNK